MRAKVGCFETFEELLIVLDDKQEKSRVERLIEKNQSAEELVLGRKLK